MNDPALIPELKVRDFKKTVGFYRDLAQFEVLYDRPEEEFAMFIREGAQIMIESLSDHSRTMKVGDMEYPFGRGMNLQIRVSDVQGLYNRFTAAKYPIFSDLEKRWYRQDRHELGNWQFWVQDPDGYLLRFYEDLGSRPL